MIYEYCTLISFFSLAFILLFASYGAANCKEQKALLSSNLTSSDSYKTYRERLEIWIKMLITFIYLLIISRMILLLGAPAEIEHLSAVPNTFVHFLLVSFVYLIFWSIIIFFILFYRNIRLDDQPVYLGKVFRIVIFLFFLDFLITGYLFMTSFSEWFSFGVISHSFQPTTEIYSSPIILYLMLVLLVIVCSLYTIFIIRRSLKIIRNYWLSILLLIATILIYGWNDFVNLTGWNESTILRIKMLSLDYGYLGWLYLIFFGATLFFNFSAIILINIRENITTPQKTKHKIIGFIKLGFVSTLIFLAMILLPEFLTNVN